MSRLTRAEQVELQDLEFQHWWAIITRRPFAADKHKREKQLQEKADS